MAQPDPLTLRKVAIARQLLSRATLSASESGAIAPAIGVSLGQDALELLLRAACQHLQAPLKPRAEFLDLIQALNTAGKPPPHGQRLEEINKTRVGFKHMGVLPDRAQAIDFVRFASIAAAEICDQCIGASLWESSAIDLVSSGRARDHLHQAQQALRTGNYKDSCLASAGAFALVFGDIRAPDRRFPPRLGDATKHLYSQDGSIDRRLDGLANYVVRDFSAVAEQLNRLWDQIDVIKYGINLEGLDRFTELTPAVDEAGSGDLRYRWLRNLDPTEEEADFCLAFALDSILRSQRNIA